MHIILKLGRYHVLLASLIIATIGYGKSLSIIKLNRQGGF
jgi:hypothetical protein